ncbi:MAG: phosphoribosylformylglycinamidine synthase [Clostridiales bacterium]|jgi:phosphoribosylformylglycinamidine synthase|nr:phosphoribosylformylglycinamidine synthase [Clostridiales bacterium]
MDNIRRLYVEKKTIANVESKAFLNDIRNNLGLDTVVNARVINCYDITGIDDLVYEKCINRVFTEPPVDDYYRESLSVDSDETVFCVKYLPGQYDQRADWAEHAIMALMDGEGKPVVVSSKVYVLKGSLSEEDINRVKQYVINPVDSMEIGRNKPLTLVQETVEPEDVAHIEGFMDMDENKLESFRLDLGLAMSREDLVHCRNYFLNEEKRNPTLTEIKVLDTYWSDHCRHTTFLTNIEDVEIEDGEYGKPIKAAYDMYMKTRKEVYAGRVKSVSLMDIATMGLKALKKRGVLKGLDESEEINACSIKVKVDVNGMLEDWLIMFKNETHNHPTEIEPFGGAATCLGGAIRDPLSGRAYVYQAMRVTGSGDPTRPVSETLKGKLSQRKITLGAASGYSSYGNQIGLATGLVNEIYDEGYIAKRMEIGAVIAAVKESDIKRERPEPGDVCILLGGRTGRDGCGGATGSSKVHTDKSITESGAEVQKGNAPTERKIQRLFRNPEVTRLIKRCNDFGAGGVSVAIGELAEGLNINLDKVPKKYDGLNGTELAISESQERMAVVVARADAESFTNFAAQENLEAVTVAAVTEEKRLVMRWRGKTIVDISRAFLDTNGAEQFTKVKVLSPADKPVRNVEGSGVKEKWLNNLSDLNVCAQKGLGERFDSTVGAGTVLMPFGGKYQLTPSIVMAAKVPVLKGETTTATLMSYAYEPKVSKWSPFHGAMYAVVESIAKIVAAGGNPAEVKLTFQEYFERLKDDPIRWGKPFAALLGAFSAQLGLNTASIGGKDSMSGTFNDLDVPPNLVSFAVCPANVSHIISPEFKKAGSMLATVSCGVNSDGTFDFARLNELFAKIHAYIKGGGIISAHTISYGGLAAALSKMAFGNRIGFNVNRDEQSMFNSDFGGFVFELSDWDEDRFTKEFTGFNPAIIGDTTLDDNFTVNGVNIGHDEALVRWLKPLESVFSTRLLDDIKKRDYDLPLFKAETWPIPAIKLAKPKVFIPVFPGTNSEYDMQRAFEMAGALVNPFVIKNLTQADLLESGKRMAECIKDSQIIAFPGGFSAGDEPDGSAKFITAMMRNQRVSEAVDMLINKNDGLILGICNGFQALIKLGLVPYGKITDITSDAPTLSFNEMGRHVSCIVNTKIVSNKSPWLMLHEAGEVHRMVISHGEGRFLLSEKTVKTLSVNGQIATQYVDFDGNGGNEFDFNPNGSIFAVEGITSPDGRIFGKMGHTERAYANEFKNIPGDFDQKIFAAGVRYFR